MTVSPRLPFDCDPPSLAVVKELRDRGMTRVAQAAEDHAPGFAELAEQFVVEYLRTHGPTSAENLSFACKRAGIVPHDDRAFGPVYMRLSRSGAIQKTGHTIRTRGHGTAGGNVWCCAEGCE